MYDYDKQTFVKPGERIIIVLPHSEVCIHMRVYDKLAYAEIGGQYGSVQLFKKDGTPFSGPITYGEAGIYHSNENGYYYYPPKDMNGLWIG